MRDGGAVRCKAHEIQNPQRCAGPLARLEGTNASVQGDARLKISACVFSAHKYYYICSLRQLEM